MFPFAFLRHVGCRSIELDVVVGVVVVVAFTYVAVRGVASMLVAFKSSSTASRANA